VHVIDQVVAELISGGLPPDTPAAVVYKASWPEQKIVSGTLADIARKVREEKMVKQSVIIVGEAVSPPEIPRSSVYNPRHSHS
ncbi:MAG: precorrin-4 C(11)-methyltransferase, partial [Pyrobaculum sp.]